MITIRIKHTTMRFNFTMPIWLFWSFIAEMKYQNPSVNIYP